jgi:hypothetical protein
MISIIGIKKKTKKKKTQAHLVWLGREYMGISHSEDLASSVPVGRSSVADGRSAGGS